MNFHFIFILIFSDFYFIIKKGLVIILNYISILAFIHDS
jgi:hypothetical protein